MRKLLNTLFVINESGYLALDGENVQILVDGDNSNRFPLHTLESIISFSYKGASPALMGACAKRGIALSFLSPSGRFLARTVGTSSGNVLLRRTQYRWADNPEKCCLIAGRFICGKIFNCRWVLERATRDHSLQLDVEALKVISASLKNMMQQVWDCTQMESLRGIEGAAAKIYFDGFGQLILRQRADFAFEQRSRRPPLDPMNAVLSFLYSLLAGDCAAALESVGLDSYVGFLHRDRPGRSSLALDLMEELRPVMADRLAIAMVNRQMIRPNHFRREAGGACYLNDEGRKIVLSSWQGRKQDVIVHPYLSEKIPWGLVPYVQALLLSRFLRGDIDGYPPFFWK